MFIGQIEVFLHLCYLPCAVSHASKNTDDMSISRCFAFRFWQKHSSQPMEWKHSSVTGPEALVKFYLQIHTKPCLALISTTALLLHTRNFCSCREIVLIHLSTVSFSVREKKWMDAAGNSWNHAVFNSQCFLERQAAHAITYLSFLPSFDFLPFLPTAIFRTTLPLERRKADI